MFEIHSVVSAINRIQYEPGVRNFKRKLDGKSWQMSCLVCGDSFKDRRKARFGITIKGNSAVCGCFNCGYSNNFISYLRAFHPSIYEELSIESIKDNAPSLFDYDSILQQNIEDSVLAKLFYIDKFEDMRQWVNFLKHKKIIMNKKSFEKLYKIRKEYWND